MSKCKEMLIGCGLAVVTSLMWLVSSCSREVNSLIHVEPPNVNNSISVKSSTTTETIILGKSTSTESPTSTTQPPTLTNSTRDRTTTTVSEPPPVGNSTPAQSSITTTEPSIVNNSTLAVSPTDIDITGYRLGINGLVNTSLSLSYKSILAYPAVTETVEIVCPGVEDETLKWTGVPVSTLLVKAGLMSGASEVVFTGMDGYSIELPLESVMQDGVFLAYTVDGQTLPPWMGYPLQLVVRGSQGSSWVKWVTNIAVKPSLLSFTNSSSIIQNSRINASISGGKLCSCILSVAIAVKHQA